MLTSCMDLTSLNLLCVISIYIITGNSEYRSALISAVCLGVALFICLIGLVIVIILLIKHKIKCEKAVLNTTADKVQSRETSVIQSSRISTKKTISYDIHTPRTESDVTSIIYYSLCHINASTLM